MNSFLMDDCYWLAHGATCNECRVEEDVSGISCCDETCEWYISFDKADEIIFHYLDLQM